MAFSDGPLKPVPAGFAYQGKIYITRRQAARLIGCTVHRLSSWVNGGSLVPYYFGGVPFFTERDVKHARAYARGKRRGIPIVSGPHGVAARNVKQFLSEFPAPVRGPYRPRSTKGR